MPAQEALPTLDALRAGYHAEVKARRRYADSHTGSLHDHWAGPAAMLMNQQTARDRRNWRKTYFNTAEGSALDTYVDRRFGKSRIELQRSDGTANLTRPSAAAGAGTIWRGTRIAVSRGGTEALRYYRATADTPVAAAAVVATVPVESETEGAGFDVGEDLAIQFVADPLWDSTWAVLRVRTSGGVDRETASELNARIRDEAWAERPGYPEAIEAACRAAGAVTVTLFQSDYLGAALDFGLNRVYVGDAGYSTSAELLRDCREAMAAAAMAGTNVQVLAMANTPLTFAITITLWDSPDRVDQGQMKRVAADAVVEYFQSRENPFVWRSDGVRAAVQRSLRGRGVQSVTVTGSQAEPVLSTLFDTDPLPRYTLIGAAAVAVSVVGAS